MVVRERADFVLTECFERFGLIRCLGNEVFCISGIVVVCSRERAELFVAEWFERLGLVLFDGSGLM